MDFEMRQKGVLKYLVIPSFEKTGLVRHGFSTRIGGVSDKPYDYLNLGLKKADNIENVLENYRIMCDAIGIDLYSLVLSDQVHSDEIYEAGVEDRGKGIWKASDIFRKDALITKQKKVALVTFYADCVPLFFLDVETPAIALAHAGWRGTVKKIGQKTVAWMMKNYGSDPGNILVGIGPCIKKCCYEVDEPVVSEFKKAFVYWEELMEDKGEGHFMLDLVMANSRQLEEIGIKPQNITISHYCTRCGNDIFFSYRADGGKTGSMAAFIELA